MKKPSLCFALGCIWNWTKHNNRAGLIKYARQLDVKGAEITIGYIEELFALKFTKSQVKWLRSLKYVSIHAPFNLSDSSKEEDIIKRMDKIQEVYNQVKASNVIIHPQQLPEKRILAKYKMRISIENMEKGKYSKIRNLQNMLKKHPKKGLCLDISHAYGISKKDTANIIKKFKERITQIHLSGTYKRVKHRSLRIVTPSFIKSIHPIRKLRVPIILEEDMTKDISRKSMNYVKKEVEYASSLLNEIYT